MSGEKHGALSSAHSLWSRLTLAPRSPSSGSPTHSPTAEGDPSAGLARRTASPLRRHHTQAMEFPDPGDAEESGGGFWPGAAKREREPLSVRPDCDGDADYEGDAEWAPRQSPSPSGGGSRAKRVPVSPGRVLMRSLPLGPQVARLVQRPWLAFAAAQILVIWLTATAVIFAHDYAARMQPKQLLKSSLGQQSLLDRLSQRLKNRCPLTGPVCRLPGGGQEGGGQGQAGSAAASLGLSNLGGPDGEKPELPLVVFFAGIEGSGHKFFEQVFRHLPINFSVVQFEPDLHLTAEKTQTHVHGKDLRCPLLPYPRPLRSFAKEILKRLKEVGPGPYLRARDSYPLGRVRTPLARPDLFHFLELDGHVYNLKVVVLQRSLADAVRSVYRAGYHGGDVGLQARIVEDEMAFLDTSIRLIPCGKYITLDFDWIADDPKLVAQPLAEFLDMGVSAEDVVRAVMSAKQTKPKHQTPYPEFGGQPMEEFFALRTDMWPLLASCRLTPYFWPHHPRDWPEESGDAAFMAERRRGYDYDDSFD